MLKNYQKTARTLTSKLLEFSYLKIAKPTSIYFRKVFELKKIKGLIGGLVLATTITAGVLPDSFSQFQIFVEANTINPRAEVVELTTEQSLQKPLELFQITKGYSFFHPAIDLATDPGSPVKSILPGKVEEIGRSRFGYGNYLVINHGSGFKSLYAHLIKINVETNQEVEKETIVAFIGSTGWSTGPHLHLEITEEGRKINPKAFFEAYFGTKLASTK